MLQANKLQPFYNNIPLNSVIFYDVTIQRVSQFGQKHISNCLKLKFFSCRLKNIQIKRYQKKC